MGRERTRGPGLAKSFAGGGIDDRRDHGAAGLGRASVHHCRVRFYGSRLRGVEHPVVGEPHGPVVRQRDAPVKPAERMPAVDRHLPDARGAPVAPVKAPAGVDDPDGDRVGRAWDQRRRDVAIKRRLGDEVVPDKFAVDVHFRQLLRAADVQDRGLPLEAPGDGDVAPPPGHAEIVSVPGRGILGFVVVLVLVRSQPVDAPVELFDGRRQCDRS